jgi:hypothetical protein
MTCTTGTYDANDMFQYKLGMSCNEFSVGVVAVLECLPFFRSRSLPGMTQELGYRPLLLLHHHLPSTVQP